jgi:hypothetical protein
VGRKKYFNIMSTKADAEDENGSQTSYYDLPFPVVVHDMVCKESKPGASNPVRWIENGAAFVLNEKAPPPNTLGEVLKRYFKRKSMLMFGTRSLSNKYICGHS